MNVLVVPSNRADRIEQFCKEWNGHFDRIVVVEDGPKKTFNISCDHYSWNEIEEEMGEDNWIISRKDSAIRSFGFLMAKKHDPDHIFTLDDDCSPIGNDFVEKHIEAMSNTPKWMMPADRRTRGVPYRNVGRCPNIALNMGMWKGVPDLNAIQALSGENWELEDMETKIIPANQYFPLCGMNLCFKPWILPLMYFPLMGEGQPYRRFDDIWCGVILKRVCDHLHESISYGPPYIRHQRLSDPLSNLKKEASGIVENEYFWEEIDRIILLGKTYEECMNEIGEHLSNNEEEYYRKLGEAIKIWVKYSGTFSSESD